MQSRRVQWRVVVFVLGVCLAVAGCDREGVPAEAAAGRAGPPGASPTPAGVPVAAPGPVATGGPGSSWLDDGRPQTGLPRMRLYLGAHELEAELALTTAAIQKGMMWRTNVAETEGMLFVFGRPHQTAFWMRNVPIDIDVAYLDTEGIIREIHRLERFNTNPVPAGTENIQFALETAEGWFTRRGIGPGVMVRTDRGSLRETFAGRGPRP